MWTIELVWLSHDPLPTTALGVLHHQHADGRVWSRSPGRDFLSDAPFADLEIFQLLEGFKVPSLTFVLSALRELWHPVQDLFPVRVLGKEWNLFTKSSGNGAQLFNPSAAY